MDRGVEAGRGYVLPRSAVPTKEPAIQLPPQQASTSSLGKDSGFSLCEGRSWKCFKQGSKSFYLIFRKQRWGCHG